jgi:hypothetical protein
MADETEYPKRGYDTQDVEAMRAAETPRRRRHWGKIALLSIIIVPAILFGLWSWITLTYTYSEGDRAGYLQKFSEKGWLCKTWEGELAQANVPGVMPETFAFSVRDDRVAADLLRQMGNRVSVTYEEHRGVPTTCFGDTDYFVVNVRPIDAPTTPAPTMPPVTPPPPQPAGTSPPPAAASPPPRQP